MLAGALCAVALATTSAQATEFVSQVPGSTQVVASQGGVSVTLGEIDAYAQTIPEDKRAGFFNSPQRIQTTILNLLFEKQLAAEARKLGLDQEAAVQAQIAQAQNSALAKARMLQFVREMKTPDMAALAQEEYIAHKEKYSTPARIDVEHVLVTIKDGDEKAAKAIADQVQAEAKARPGQFEALVQKYSDDPTKGDNKGLVANADGKQMAPEFAEAARALKKVGEISPVVKTEFGFHVLKLVAHVPMQAQPFAQVRDKILVQLRDQYVKKQTANYTDGLRNLPIDANQEAVASLRTRYAGAATTPSAKGVETN